MSIFNKKQNPRPYDYPEAIEFAKAIRNNIWFVDEFEGAIKADVNDYLYELDEVEREVFKRTILAISQIEVSVKRFWTNLYNLFPRVEFDILGTTHGFSEISHFESYSLIIEELGLTDDFEKIKKIPCIQGRVDYLEKYLKFNKKDKASVVRTVILFSEFIEESSLFSQFYIAKSILKKTKRMKTIDNIIKITATEEDIHFQTGAWIINKIKQELPELFNQELEDSILEAMLKAYKAEVAIIDWIFEEGTPSFISKQEVVEYLKYRFNRGLVSIGYKSHFEVDEESIKEGIEWFEAEQIVDVRNDFFDTQSDNYTLGTQSFSVDSITI